MLVIPYSIITMYGVHFKAFWAGIIIIIFIIFIIIIIVLYYLYEHQLYSFDL